MELKIIKHQRGYLLIVAIIAIVIIGFVAGILADMYLTTTKSTTNVLQADQALYIAKAGLEITKRNLIKTNSTLTCAGATTFDTLDVAYPPGCSGSACLGHFRVTGTPQDNSSAPPSLTSPSGISNTDTNIALTTTTGLLSQGGIVLIENELIWYPAISGTTSLQNVKRGVAGTQPIAHNVNTPVIQNVCLLTSTAGVPDLTTPGGKRVVNEMLQKSKGGVGSFPGKITPTLVSGGRVTLQGNAGVYNNSVTKTSSNYYGSTIVTAATDVPDSKGKITPAIDFQGNASTAVGSTAVTASEKKNYSPGDGDLIVGNSDYVSSKLWNYVFKSDQLTTQSSAITVSSNCSSYNYNQYTTPKVFWITNCSTFNPSGDSSTGTTDTPVTLVFNGDVELGGNANIYGMIYVIGNLTDQGSPTVNGLTVVEGTTNIQGTHGSYFNTDVLTNLGLLGSYTKQSITWENFGS